MISLKTKTILWVSSVLVPLAVVVMLFNVYTVYVSNQQVHESAVNVISLYKSEIESDLQNVEKAMLGFQSSNPSYRQLRYATDVYTMTANVYEVTNRYWELVSTFPSIGCVYLYAGENNIARVVYRSGYAGQYEFKVQLERALKEMVEQETNPTRLGWHYIEADGRKLLARAVGRDGLFTVCVVDPLLWKRPQNSFGQMMYADETGRPVAVLSGQAELYPDISQNTNDTYFVAGKDHKSRISLEKSAYAKTIFYYVQPYHGIFGALNLFQLAVLLGTLLLFGTIPFLMAEFNKTSFKPMENMMKTMDLVRGGDASAKMEADYPVLEFHAFAEMFNNMLNEIHELKIETYEKELKQQKTNYALLQAQIRPHFYLNCLKNIQAMAQQQNWSGVENLVLYLSNYLRHLFRSAEDLVTLESEMESVKSYIEIQNLTAEHPIYYYSELQARCKSILLPPLSVLTFVENAIKHGRLPDSTLKIGVKCIWLESGEERFLNLSVTDNGCGMSQTMLEELNEGKHHGPAGHVGIDNVLGRMKLKYGEKFSYMFYNLCPGTEVELFMPMTGREREEKNL